MGTPVAPFDTIDIRGMLVGELLRGYRFLIPAFQRPYAWSTKEWDETLRDLTEHHAAQSTHPGEFFFGNVALERTEEADLLVVADGQQRLTTVTLLLAAIDYVAQQYGESADSKDLLFESKVTPRGNELVPRLTDQSAAGRATLAALLSAPDPKSVGNTQVERGYKALVQMCSDLAAAKGVADVIALRFSLLTKFKLAVTLTSPGNGARIFALTNTRGKALDDADLAKAAVISECADTADVEKAAANWRSAVMTLGQAGASAKRGIVLWAAAAFSETGTPVRPSEARTLVSQAAHEARAAGAVAPVVADFAAYAEAYAKSRVGRSPDDRSVAALKNIVRSPMLAQQKQLPALVPAARKLAPADFDKFAAEVERTMVVVATVKAFPPHVEKLVAKVLPILRGVTKLTDPDGVKVLAMLKNLRDSLKQEFADAVVNATEDELPNRCAITLLGYVEAEMEGLVSGAPRGEIASGCSVEHVLAQRLTEEAILEYGDEEAARHDRYRLGNMAIIEQPLNSKASNLPFSEKAAKHYPNTSRRLLRSLTMPLGAQANALKPYEQWFGVVSQWTPAELEKRAEGLHRVLCDVLDVEYVTPGPVRRAELEVEIPQADDLDLLLKTVQAVGDGQARADDIAVVLGMHGRTGSYYLSAAKLAGLVEDSDDAWVLTTEGDSVVASPDPTGALRRSLAQLPLLVRYSQLPTGGERLAYIGSAHLADSTAKRRKKTLDKWLEFVAPEYV